METTTEELLITAKKQLTEELTTEYEKICERKEEIEEVARKHHLYIDGIDLFDD